MSTDEIDWQKVPNTVKKRMINLSMIHRLIPSQKLRRRTKTMNNTLGRLHHLETYSQYVKMKTSILRSLSDDSSTDDDESLTDNDDSDFNKSNLSLKDNTTCVSTVSPNDFCTANFDIIESDIVSGIVNERKNKQRSKNKSSKIVKLGWQGVTKKKNKKLTFLSKRKTQRETPDDSNETKNYNSFVSCSDKSTSCKEYIISTDQKASNTENLIESNKTKFSINADKDIKSKDNEPIEKANITTNDINEDSEIKHYYKTIKRKRKLNDTQKDLIPILSHDDANQDIDTPFTNTKVNLKHSCTLLSNGNMKVQGNSMNDGKSDKFFPPIQSSIIYNTNQPKDSGIDEDTEEEFPEDKKGTCVQGKEEIQEVCESNEPTLSTLDHRNNSVTETTNVTTADSLVSDSQNISSNIGYQHAELCTTKSTNDKEEQQNKIHKQKLQPKVTCTEIVSKKYKIVSSNTLLFDNSTGPEISNSCDKKEESIEVERNKEDSMSSLSKRRLQQLKRLNLIVDSESSLSSDDDQYCNIENMRDKLFKRSKDSSDSSDSDNEDVPFKHTISIHESKKFKKSRIFRSESDRNEQNIRLQEMHTICRKGEEASNTKELAQLLILAKANGNVYEHTSNYASKKEACSSINQCKENFQNSLKQNQYSGHNEDNNTEWTTKFEESLQLDHETDKYFKTETQIQFTNNNSAVCSRPCNIQELIEKEGLKYETTSPSFTLKDVQENDIFLLDVPSMVFRSQLLGKKLILTKTKLQFGKQKYRIAFHDVDHVSCVFSTGKSRKTYKPGTQ
ncbi:PREDICTED: dentin sialophosphoprotein-like [Dufourea novaeangliae]|uniref:dentin sialophosphoprotein-like n=1 Tax=Dufourea novaeangliae TaxID=178035 RepID=UPI000767A584|nr:PREDICTED: dentin sialophosphoprotein-like [Dufourea novaeangliae]